MDVRDLVFDPDRTRSAFDDALRYLDECGIFVPDFRLRIKRQWGGSQVTETARGMFMTLGCYPTRACADWFAMHELAHVLFAAFDPLSRRRFRAAFGSPEPEEYDRQQIKASAPRWMRPRGFPSYYARDGGGEEHFAELVAFMYTADRAFASAPPPDLRTAWRVAWNDGLARMIEGNLA